MAISDGPQIEVSYRDRYGFNANTDGHTAKDLSVHKEKGGGGFLSA
ncbi:MAG: hypothetical protein M0Z36_04475 [Thermaerobacter sp.]|nr:hypothetical protein [Thermaerobacter sp.]